MGNKEDTPTDWVDVWFDTWERGDILNLPLSENFVHISPYGTIRGKSQYLKLVQANRDRFLGNRFIIHNRLGDGNPVCVRYTLESGNSAMEIAEWLFLSNSGIDKDSSYYKMP